MENNKGTITANEINKYAYCPYQWYYERKYGRKKLRELAKIRNERLGLTDTGMSNLKAGTEYHDSVEFRTGIGLAIFKILIVGLIILGIFIVLKVKFNV